MNNYLIDDITYHRNRFLLNTFDQKLFKNLFKIKCELLFFKKLKNPEFVNLMNKINNLARKELR